MTLIQTWLLVGLHRLLLEKRSQLLVAAGFDAALGDQLGGCFVTPTCYAHMAHMLSPLANGKVVVCLEVSRGTGYVLA